MEDLFAGEPDLAVAAGNASPKSSVGDFAAARPGGTVLSLDKS